MAAFFALHARTFFPPFPLSALLRYSRTGSQYARPDPFDDGDAPQNSPGIKIGSTAGSGDVREAVRAYLIRSSASNVPLAVADRFSRLRQFIGSAIVDALDPRTPEKLRHAKKGRPIEPWFKGNRLAEITPSILLGFLHEKTTDAGASVTSGSSFTDSSAWRWSTQSTPRPTFMHPIPPRSFRDTSREQELVSWLFRVSACPPPSALPRQAIESED